MNDFVLACQGLGGLLLLVGLYAAAKGFYRRDSQLLIRGLASAWIGSAIARLETLLIKGQLGEYVVQALTTPLIFIVAVLALGGIVVIVVGDIRVSSDRRRKP